MVSPTLNKGLAWNQAQIIYFIEKQERKNIVLEVVGLDYHTTKIIIEAVKVYILYMQSLANHRDSVNIYWINVIVTLRPRGLVGT